MVLSLRLIKSRRSWAGLSKLVPMTPDIPHIQSSSSSLDTDTDAPSDLGAPFDGVYGMNTRMLCLYSLLVGVPEVVRPTTIRL